MTDHIPDTGKMVSAPESLIDLVLFERGYDRTEGTSRAILSALAAAGYVVERGWQPIETAPRDGAPIWAWNGEYCQMEWFASDEWSGWLHCDPLLSDADPDPVQPTAWRHLPAPPAAKEPQG